MRITYWFWKFGFLGEGDILPEAQKKWGAMKNWEGGEYFREKRDRKRLSWVENLGSGRSGSACGYW